MALHDLLQAGNLDAAIAWVLEHHRGELSRHGDILHVLQGHDPRSGARDAARFLTLFLLLVDDTAGARLAIRLSRAAGSPPMRDEIYRIAADPHACLDPEPLTAEADRYALRRLRLAWSSEPPEVTASMRIPPLIARLEGGSVLGLSFVPVTANGVACFNLFVFNRNNPAKVLGFEDENTFPVIGPRSFTACFSGTDEYARGMLIGNGENFGHWLLNHLARLALVSSVPALNDIPLVVGENVTPTQLECLRLMGYDESRVIRLRKGRIARFETLWAPMMPLCGVDNRLFWSPGIVDFLRQRLGVGRRAGPAGARAGPRRRLYLTRNASRWRHVLNENAILDAIAGWGFEVVDPGTLTVAQQLALAAEAEVVMGPFGAGMNLLLFAPDDAAVVEFKPYERLGMDINPALARQIGQRYVEVVGTPSIVEGVPPLNYDFSVPADRVVSALESLGIAR